MRNAETGFDAGELTTGELVTFHKQPQSAEPDAASQRTEFHSKQIYLFWKGVCKAECGAKYAAGSEFSGGVPLGMQQSYQSSPAIHAGLESPACCCSFVLVPFQKNE